MFRFQNIELLTGLALIPFLLVLFFRVLRWKKTRIKKIGDPGLVKELIKGYSPARFSVKFVMVLLAFAAIVTAAGNLQKPGEAEKVSRKGVDVMIALDVSKSMLAEDIKPSRLERARQLVNKLMDKMENDRIGIVLFAGRAYIQMPLTTDHGAAKMYIQNASPEAVPSQGTVIGEALRISNTAFNSKEHTFKSIVLISDGEDHDPEALKMTKALSDNGVMINAVGIGSPEGVPIVDKASNELRKDAEGNAIVTKLNEPELQQLAKDTKGIYVRLDDTNDAVQKIKAQLDTIEQQSLGGDSYINYKSYFQWFLAAAFLFLLIELLTSERRRIRQIPVKKAVLTPLLLLLMSVAFAQKENGFIRSGNKLYRQNDFNRSMEEYKKALARSPQSPLASYNLGNAQFRTNQLAESVSSYDATIQNGDKKPVKEQAFYNKGVAYSKQQKLQESIDSWKNALKLVPGDQEARENLQKALLELKKQQKEKEDSKKDKKENKKDQQKQDKDKQEQQPQQQQSRLNKKQVEQLLKALEQKEKEVQQKMQSKNSSPSQQEKDW